MSSDLIDAVGTAHLPADPNPRIVSLVPSITELLFDLGLGACVVGRTHFCVHPARELEAVVSVGGTKKISNQKLESLGATYVILNIDENTKAMAAEVATIVPNLIVTHPIEPEDNLGLYRLIGGIFGRIDQAQNLCTRFNNELADLRAASLNRPRRNVVYLIWKDPWMTVSRDTYVSRFLALAGWDTVAHADEERYPAIEIDAALLAATHPGAHCLLIDGELTSWYGSRAIAGLGYLKNLTTEIALAPSDVR